MVVLEHGDGCRELGPFHAPEEAALAQRVLQTKAAGVQQDPAAAASLDELADQLQCCADHAGAYQAKTRDTSG
ncbi:hypothetical protein ABPG75_012091 [Micractinium tetrahymenae]